MGLASVFVRWTGLGRLSGLGRKLESLRYKRGREAEFTPTN